MVRLHRKGVRTARFVPLLACLIGALGQACQVPNQSTRIACGSCEGQDRMVRLQSRNGTVEKGWSPFTHPLDLSPEEWARILRSVHVQGRNPIFYFLSSKGPAEPAFTDDEITYLSTMFSRVFARAQPEEWVVFALSRVQSPEVKEVTTGAWFVEGPLLRFLLAHYRYAVTMPSIQERIWQYPLRPDSDPPYDFIVGQYQTAGDENAPFGQLFLATLPVLSITYQPLLQGESALQSADERKKAVPDQVSPPQSRTSSPKPSIEERLQALKRLRDQGLISEEEYRIKKKQLLDGL